MTRINVVPVSELHQKHLGAEYREIIRVFALVRNMQKKYKTISEFIRAEKVPMQYVLGTGHVKFFYNKLGYILKRYHQLTNEMVRRGYSPNPVPDSSLVDEVDEKWFGEYTPTTIALEINCKRIQDRLDGV